MAGASLVLGVVRSGGTDTLTWTIDDASGLTGFLVCRTRQGYFYPAVDGYLPVEAEVGTGTLTYTFSDMDTWDDYQVVGVAYGIRGPRSEIFRVPAAVPDAPILVAWGQVASDGQVDWTHPWQSAPAGGLDYRFEVRNVTAAIGWSGAGTVSNLALSSYAPALADSLGAPPSDADVIEVRMRAYNGTDYSDWSSVMSFEYSI